MAIQDTNSLEKQLKDFTESDWQDVIDSLLPSIHEVDRNAVQIWFRFYPLSLHKYVESSSDPDQAKRAIAMQGEYCLADRIDTSHYFLYGHRHWKDVKAAIESENDVESGLEDIVRRVASNVSARTGTPVSLLLAVTAVGLMTLVQVGTDRFRAASAERAKPAGSMAKSPESVIAERGKDDSQGLFGFLKTVDKKFSVIHDESKKNGRFEVLNDQEIASASANDRSQDWQARDPRCWEGPVPVECTSASCGTCWVGVIAGAEKLSEVARRERRAVKVFGYSQSDDPKPIIRLACQAKAYGNITIVIPPWNAVFGKKVYGNVEELELEPATTSAKALRDTVREATAGE